MSYQVFSTPEIKDKLRLAEDSRDAERAGLTLSEIHRVLDSASYALCRAFPAARASFIFRGRRYHATMQGGFMRIFRTADNRLICERRQAN
jgi:hypothetical protein